MTFFDKKIKVLNSREYYVIQLKVDKEFQITVNNIKY